MDAWIRKKALEIGFDLVGISPARAFAEHMALKAWVSDGMHGSMEWFERGLEKRLDPLKVMPEAQSVIVCTKNYNADFPYSTECQDNDRGWIARYAWGDDYHETLLEMLKQFVTGIEKRVPGVLCKPYVDTGPNMERVFAKHAGIGWLGKNTCLINMKQGSFLFLAVVLTDLALEPDTPETDHCGTCTRCIDACPTNALTEPYKLDARRCISYLTIEHRGDIDPELQSQMGNHIFGCDICQDVCPWNRKSPRSNDFAFQPRDGFFNPDLNEFKKRVEEGYPQGFKHSPLKRAKKKGLLRNIDIAMRNSKQ